MERKEHWLMVLMQIWVKASQVVGDWKLILELADVQDVPSNPIMMLPYDMPWWYADSANGCCFFLHSLATENQPT